MIEDRSGAVPAQRGVVRLFSRPEPYVALFVMTVALMVAAVRIPPILDYPNHFARFFLLSGGIEQPFFGEAYAIDWSRARTNIGMDLLAHSIGPAIGPELLARASLFLAIVLPPLGAINLNRKIFGKGHPFHVAILFLAWSTTLTGGFINFQIGLGLALLFAVIDLQIGQHRVVVVNLWRMLACTLLTLDHIFAAGFYLVLSAGLELPSDFRALADFRTLRLAAVRIALAATAGLTPVATLVLSATGLPGNEAGIALVWNSPLLTLSNFLSAITSYLTFVDVVFLVPIIIVVVEARSRGAMRFHAGLLASSAFLLLLSALAPRHAMATGWICWRFPIMTLLAGAAAICPFPTLSGAARRRIITGMTATVFLRTAFIAVLWWQGNQDAKAVQQAVAKLPPNSKVLPLAHFSRHRAGLAHASRYFFWNEDTIRHLPALATVDSGAFVPTLFTAVGKQPLTVTDGFKDISVPEGNLLPVGALLCEDMHSFYLSFTPYISEWRQRFDYILIVNADMSDRFTGTRLPDGLSKVADTGFAALYAIDKSQSPPRFSLGSACPEQGTPYPS